ncbi:pepsin/retropepsin-like aspartic protease family protein [Frigoriglobus tundricola]|uniref:Uncharacterized protein n=1 Tax=Frigoriglobus tundricola TaxID=2774151 RepID=A0A6M5YSG2_9BACT|nr:hypothetical protein [Frigoriglobus tundricola]QJW96346.1 hypothetical protein FTUN_3903 [Frigoriglobus tundricola]
MRVPGRIALFGLAIALSAALAASAADDPPPLLKPVAPQGNQVRVRAPLTPGYPKTMQLTAQVPKVAKGGKKTELVDVLVALDSMPNPSYVTAKKLESWGYVVPKNKEFVLPELLVPAAQVAPKPAKGGTDAVVRLTNIRLTVVDTPASGDDTIFFSDMSLSSSTLYQNGERAMEPRLSFGDKYLELTVPSAIVKRPGTDNFPTPPATASTDAKLAPAVGATTLRNGLPVFSYAAVNGQESYKLASGTTVPVNVVVASISNWDTGVVVTVGLARGCKVETNVGMPGATATGAEGKSEMVPGKIKELRLGFATGPGLKEKKDLVLKDVPVWVDKNVSEGLLYLGPKFMDTHVQDAVYAGGADGWKLYGRINQDLLFDIKTRKKP